MEQKTALFPLHCQLGAQIINFAGWQMPLNYGSQIAEHHAVRQRAGMFDVSHMGIIDISGRDSTVFLRYALANDVKKLAHNGRALYSCLLNSRGGIIDDLIAYRIGPRLYRLIVNASQTVIDLEWLTQLGAAYDIKVQQNQALSIVAIQGPQALLKLSQTLTKSLAIEVNALKPFHFLVNNDWQISRTGYTGEDGVEVMLPFQQVSQFWTDLLSCEVQPCGLGARDTLRMEAGFNLYGADMDETTTPAESNLEWTVAWLDSKRNFVGREALAKQKQLGVKHQLVGLVMEEAGVLRSHLRVLIDHQDVGEITSGGFSPTLGRAIAMARIDAAVHSSTANIERRGKLIPVRISQLPFLK